MKKLYFLSVLAILSFSISCSQTTVDQSAIGNTKPGIEFDKMVHDYGTIEQNADGGSVFTFKNTGNSPLILNNVKSSCGCTIPSWPKEPIAPGEESSIKVQYKTSRVGPINKSISIYSNATETPVIIKIKGTVTAKAAAPAPEATIQKKE